ncbi:MAG: YihY/virulence factor BrkB family protein [Verrucomicrobiota bacterium]|nr:YihY/virulence factor BrkB family protein [Verrucomicrobiota bacterium]
MHKSPVFGSFAAALAFYFILSMIPFLVVTFKVIGQFSPLNLADQIIDMLGRALPRESHDAIEPMIQSAREAASGGFMTLTFFIAIWTSNNFMLTWVHSLQFIFSEKGMPSNILKKYLWSFLLLLLWMAALVLTAWFLVMAPVVQGWLELSRISKVTVTLWILARYITLFVILYVSFYSTYRTVAKTNYTISALREGAAMGAVGWILVSFIFSRLLPQMWNQSAIYGALGSLIATMIWAYATAWVMVLGACWIVRFGQKTVEEPTITGAN